MHASCLVILSAFALLLAIATAAPLGACNSGYDYSVIGFNSSWVWTPIPSASVGSFVKVNDAWASQTDQLWYLSAVSGGGNQVLSAGGSVCLTAINGFAIFNSFQTCDSPSLQTWDVIQVGTGNAWKICKHSNNNSCVYSVYNPIGLYYSLSTGSPSSFQIIYCCTDASNCVAYPG